MSATAVLVVVLLTFGVIVEGLAVLGLVILRTTMQRLHVVGPATVVGPVLIALATALGTHATPAQGAKGLLIALVLLTFAGVLSHETARAAAARDGGR